MRRSSQYDGDRVGGGRGVEGALAPRRALPQFRVTMGKAISSGRQRESERMFDMMVPYYGCMLR
jgi:hypothetical protein